MDGPRPDTPLTFEAEPLDLPFCHLVIVSDSYAGRVGRVQATYALGIHGPVLLDRSCPGPRNSVWVSLSPAAWAEVARAMEDAYGTKEVSGPLGVVAVGRFERNSPSGGSDSLADSASYKIELVRMERAVRPR